MLTAAVDSQWLIKVKAKGRYNYRILIKSESIMKVSVYRK
jgi:hypothetical protein